MRQRFLKATDESVELLEDIRDGRELEDHVTMFGGVIPVQPRIRDKLAAVALLQKGATMALAADKPAGEQRRVLEIIMRHE